MTVERHDFIIGNSWGKPPGMEGPEHYWRYGSGDERSVWRSICGSHVLEASDSFKNMPAISLTFENNPLQVDRCPLCEAAYLDTDLGKRVGFKRTIMP